MQTNIATRSIIFDLDHTLLYSDNLENDWFETCNKYNLDNQTISDIWYSSKGLHLWAQLIKSGITDLQLQNQIIDDFWITYLKNVNPILLDGAFDLIKELANTNIKLFVSTGTNSQVAKTLLDKVNLLSYFDLVLGSDYNFFKGPAHYYKIISYLYENNLLNSKDKIKDNFKININNDFGNNTININNYLNSDFGFREIAVGDGQMDMLYAFDFRIKTRLGIKDKNLFNYQATNIINNLTEVLYFVN